MVDSLSHVTRHTHFLFIFIQVYTTLKRFDLIQFVRYLRLFVQGSHFRETEAKQDETYQGKS